MSNVSPPRPLHHASHGPPPPAWEETPVTTTDALKLFALALVFVDHHGFFFDPENAWWRLFGRLAAPVFFFLIGFARTRRVPISWLALGLALTTINAWKAPALQDTMVNILLNFALLRAIVLPPVERYVMMRPLAVAALVLLCLALLRVTDGPLEYGTEGWLWAFAGLAHRLWLDEGGERMLWTRNVLAAVAAAAYVVGESLDFPFDRAQIWLLVALVAALMLVLLHFRREALSRQPPAIAGLLFRFCGRHSLEIYAIGLFVSHALAYAVPA